jgi:hypothetical protein
MKKQSNSPIEEKERRLAGLTYGQRSPTLSINGLASPTNWPIVNWEKADEKDNVENQEKYTKGKSRRRQVNLRLAMGQS